MIHSYPAARSLDLAAAYLRVPRVPRRGQHMQNTYIVACYIKKAILGRYTPGKADVHCPETHGVQSSYDDSFEGEFRISFSLVTCQASYPSTHGVEDLKN